MIGDFAMRLVLPRILPGVLGLFCAALTLSTMKTKKKNIGRGLSALCALASVGLIAQVAPQMNAASALLLATSLVPWLVLAALFLAQAALFILKESSAAPGLFAVSIIQFGLSVYSLVSKWRNFAVGEKLWLYIQLILLILLAADVVLLGFAAFGRKKGARHG
jgi:hypothetical protein